MIVPGGRLPGTRTRNETDPPVPAGTAPKLHTTVSPQSIPPPVASSHWVPAGRIANSSPRLRATCPAATLSVYVSVSPGATTALSTPMVTVGFGGAGGAGGGLTGGTGGF